MAIYQINQTGPYYEWSDLPTLNPTDVVEVLGPYSYNGFDINNLSGVTVAGTNDPIFGSLKTATGWANLGGGLWSVSDAALGTYLNMLVIDGVPRKKGRFPKNPEEYYTIPSDSSDGSLNHGTLPFVASGEIVIRLQSFVTNTYTVTADSGGVISFTGHTGQYPPKQGYGFALQNQIECLTEDGDWMYNSATKTITIYYSGTPSDYVIQYPTAEEAMTITDSDNLIFSGIQFVGSNGDGINVSNSTDLSFENCGIKYSGGMGVRLADGNCDDVTFADCRVDHAFAGGFYAFFGCDRVSAIRCTSKNIGMVEGGSRYMNYDGRSNGFCFEGGTDNKFQDCYAEDCGFNGFVYGGNGTQVLNNVAKRFGAKKSDCGGFYTYNPEGTITDPIILRKNIAMDGIGNAFGTPDPTPNCQGFYFDDGTNGVDTSMESEDETNLSINNPVGTYCHNTRDNIFSCIVNYGNKVQLKLVSDSELPMTNNVYSGGWNVITEIDQEFVSTYGTLEEIAGFGTFSGNRYSNFKTGRPVFSTWDGVDPKPYAYGINPDVHFTMLGEVGQTLENYDEIPYTIVNQLGTVNYKTTIPAFGQFGYISGITPTFDASGATVTKVGSPKTSAFIRLGTVEDSTWYLVESSEVSGDYDDLEVDFESNYVAPGVPIKNGKIDTTSFAIPLFSAIDRATEQFYLLMEVPFSSITFGDLTFSEITVERTVSTAAIEINEETQTWEIFLDGELPPDLDITFPSQSFVYDGTLKSLSIVGDLPDGYSVEYTNNGRTNVGTQVVTATVTNGVDELILEADLTITPATITGITFPDGIFVYDGTLKSIFITGSIPSGTSVSYLNNTRTAVGTQEATATITGSNYTTLILHADLTITPQPVGEDEVVRFNSKVTAIRNFISKVSRSMRAKSKTR